MYRTYINQTPILSIMGNVTLKNIDFIINENGITIQGAKELIQTPKIDIDIEEDYFDGYYDDNEGFYEE